MDWSAVGWAVYNRKGDLMFLLFQDPATQSVMTDLFNRYGATGLAFGTLLVLILRQNKSAQKRIEDLEKAQQDQHIAHMQAHKQMIEDYVDLVKNKTKVLADLTGCLNAIKDTLERMERKNDKD
jgi:hypothetical protein